MRRLVRVAGIVGIVFGSVTMASAVKPPKVTGDDFDQWMTDLNNWGRWGEDDQLGALNLITAEKRRAAAALVRDGVSVSLAHDVLTDGAPDNPSPFEHEMIPTGASPWAVDSVKVNYHGLAHTHMDALCHVSYKGDFYNGVKRAEVDEDGCPRLGIAGVHGGIFTRGVLIDIPWLKGVDALEPGEPVTLEDLLAWEKKSGVEIEPGDALLLRTGRWTRRAEKGPWATTEGFAGFHASAIPWLKAKDPAILGSDAGLDVMPAGLDNAPGVSPIHMFTIVALGANILDNGDFEELATEAKARGRWDFLLTFAPMRIVGGTGSPLNPIATF